MRVLFVTLPARTHLYNQVSLAWAMAGAGHEVCVASPPEQAEETQRIGLPAVGVGPRLDLTEKLQAMQEFPDFHHTGIWTDIGETRPERMTWDFVANIVTNMAYINQSVNNDMVIDDMYEFAKSWQPDLVIWDPMMFSGGIVARAVGAAHARLMWGLDLMGRLRNVFLGFQHTASDMWQDPMRGWLEPTMQRLGSDFSEELLTGVWTIDQMPPFMRIPLDLHVLPMRFTPYNGPAPIQHWALAKPERPRICVSLGLTDRETGEKPDDPLSAIFEAVSDLDVEVIATLDEFQLQSVPNIPDNVRAVDFAPLRTLLPTCSAIVHHGGGGTFGNALLHGVPQLVVPDNVWDTTLTGKHIADRGVGLCAPPGEYSAVVLRKHLVALLEEPSYRKNADEVRAEALATPGPNEVVQQLEKLVAERAG